MDTIPDGSPQSTDRSSTILLDGLQQSERERILASGSLKSFAPGNYVYRQGNATERFYLVIEGTVELAMNTACGGQLVVSHIGPGGHFGEASLLTGKCHSVDAKALSRLTLMVFNREAFSKLLDIPVIQQRLFVALAERLKISFRHQANAVTPKVPAIRHLQDVPDRSGLSASIFTRHIQQTIETFGTSTEPVLISGERGTGRRMIAYRIHQHGRTSQGPYIEIDLHHIPVHNVDAELYGLERSTTSFTEIEQAGALEKGERGTVILYGAEHLEPDIQRQLVRVLRSGKYRKIGGQENIELTSRIILICNDKPGDKDGHARLLPTLFSLLQNRHLRLAPLRDNRRELPDLADYYLRRYSQEYGKSISRIDERTMGMIMNYDWPGNLDELSTVIRRAVILADNNRPLHSKIFLGVPRPEGKWEFNLLRLPSIRALFMHRLFPILPRILVGVFLLALLATLFFGPDQPGKNIGLTLSWQVGWPLLIFSFFFLARTWCSICGLALPGYLAQRLTRPQRATPELLRRYSGWLVAALCISLFWIELTWGAYTSPYLTGAILVAISSGALLFSILYERRVWCRYLCPLGGLNALFSMSSILELRANSHMCLNHCTDHSCYSGVEHISGCPMFRHPFMVDNNRDCILCGQCIKNCSRQSIHLNFRLAPQELWNQRAPRLEDALLIVSLAAIFILFALHDRAGIPAVFGTPLSFSILFFATILLHILGYAIFSGIMAKRTATGFRQAAAVLSYGFIPLILAAYLAAHVELFVRGVAEIIDWLSIILHLPTGNELHRLISRDATLVIQTLTLLGGLFAALFATKKNVLRLVGTRPSVVKPILLPPLLLFLLTGMYFYLLL